jgi:hypothetical protein
VAGGDARYITTIVDAVVGHGRVAVLVARGIQDLGEDELNVWHDSYALLVFDVATGAWVLSASADELISREAVMGGALNVTESGFEAVVVQSWVMSGEPVATRLLRPAWDVSGALQMVETLGDFDLGPSRSLVPMGVAVLRQGLSSTVATVDDGVLRAVELDDAGLASSAEWPVLPPSVETTAVFGVSSGSVVAFTGGGRDSWRVVADERRVISEPAESFVLAVSGGSVAALERFPTAPNDSRPVLVTTPDGLAYLVGEAGASPGTSLALQVLEGDHEPVRVSGAGPLTHLDASGATAAWVSSHDVYTLDASEVGSCHSIESPPVITLEAIPTARQGLAFQVAATDEGAYVVSYVDDQSVSAWFVPRCTLDASPA